MKKKIWTTLCDTKFKSFCLNLLVNKFQHYDRNINVFLAIAASGSIAAWAIWDIFPMLWGGYYCAFTSIDGIKTSFSLF